VYRHEVKYHINRHDAYMLERMLGRVMHMDANCDADGSYWIRSLYFDSQDNRDYIEKLCGVAERKKLRLRIYDTDTAAVKLEIKNKSGSFVFKETAEIKRDDAYKLICGEKNVLLIYDDRVSRKAFAIIQRERIRPVILIDYERTAFTYPFDNIRITLDKNVRASLHTGKIFDPSIPTDPVFPDGRYILEVKFKTTLPGFIRTMLASVNPLYTSVSKYCLARQTISV
jgi:SPX domain protein involved in polyphosphate accumulation